MKNNENGYALIIVLLLVTLTFTFALALSGMAFSARKQIDKTDEINRATDLAEMGVAHYEALMNNFVKDALSETAAAIKKVEEEAKNRNHPPPVPDFDELFKTSMASKVSNVPQLIKNVKENHTYQVDFKGISGKAEGQILTIAFTSTGTAENESKILTGSFEVEKQKRGPSLADTPVPTPDEFDTVEDTPLKVNHSKSYSSSVYFSKGITWDGGRKKTFIVRGNAFFNEQLTIHGSARIEIHGDAFFKNKLSETEGSYSFCISGTPYLVGSDGKLKVYENFPAGRTDACPAQKNGQWAIDPDEGVTVNY